MQDHSAECQPSPLPHYIRPKGLLELTGLGKTTVSAMQDPASPQFDPTFPAAYRLTARTKVWKTSSVIDWIESRVAVNVPSAAHKTTVSSGV